MKGAVLFFVAIALLAGCKKQVRASTDATSSEAGKLSATSDSRAPLPTNPTVVSAATPTSESTPLGSNSTGVTGESRFSDAPRVEVGLSVDQAYAAIPHRRAVWTESGTTVPADERAYLKAIFGVVDEAIAVRVAGLQNFSQQRFGSADVSGQLERLISFARSMPVPARLKAYHSQILTALAADRQFFAEWKAQGANFPFAQQLAANGNVQAASSAARAAYSELMSKYPGESQSNKDAFFDYHCALDFL